jgi:hypothetical protein
MQAAADHANQALRDTRASPATLDLVGPAFQAAQGQFFLRAGPREKGRAMLRDLVEQIRALPGPDNWVQTLFTLEAIARTARDAGDWEFSAWAAAQMIAHDANYAGSHYARALVAEHDGDRPTAAAEFALAARYWGSADPTLPELARIRGSRGAPPFRNR